MNRKKKIHAIFKKRLKKAKAKLSPNTSHKSKYISKAERARLEQSEKEPTTQAGAIQPD